MSEVPRLIDPTALRRARERSRRAGGGPDFLAARVAEDLELRLAATLRPLPRALDLGSPGDATLAVLRARPTAAEVSRYDFETSEGGDAGQIATGAGFQPESFDLIVSCLALQHVDDLPGVFAQARRLLAPDGLFLAGFLGGETLTELRQSFAAAEAATIGGLSPRVLPFADVRAVGGLLQRAGFALPVVDLDRVTVRYPNPLELMADLRAWGATNVLAERSRRFMRRDTLAAAMEIYGEQFSDPDGRIRATFEIVWASGWAPHDSQQKPLRPGSAQARLAEALGVKEGDPD